MKKITKLSEDQTALMAVVRDEWIARCDSCQEIDEDAVKAGITWFYEAAKYPAPNFCWVESPYGAQLAANILNGSAVDPAVLSAVDSAVDSAVRSAVRSDVDSAVYSVVYSAVDSAVYSAVLSAVRSAVRSDVDSAVGANKLRYHYFCQGAIYTYGWAAWVDYYHRIGAIDIPEAKRYLDLLRGRAMFTIFLDKWAIVCALPSNLERDSQQRLHSVTGPAIEWKDSYGLHFIHGVQFSPDLFQKVTADQLTAKEILKLENMEQRMIALKLHGAEKMLQELDAVKLDHSARGNELYLIKDVFDVDAYFLKYACPSTARVYVSGVDPDVARETKSADACMAWKHNMTTEQYAMMQPEHEA